MISTLLLPCIAIVMAWLQVGPDHWWTPAILLSITVAFALWLNLMQQKDRISRHFSTGFLVISVTLIGGACALFPAHIGTRPYAIMALLGLLASLFIFVDVREAVAHAWQTPTLTVIAALTAMMPAIYTLTSFWFWERLSSATSVLVAMLLRLAGIRAEALVTQETNIRILVKAPEFAVVVTQGCCGMEGIFMFFMLLSVILLLDWRLLDRLKLTAPVNLAELYTIGLIYMFFINTLRITSFFMVGAHYSDGGDASARIVDLFHTNIGWLLYLAAFIVFITLFYMFVGYKKRHYKA